MQSRGFFPVPLSIAAALLLGCDKKNAVGPLPEPGASPAAGRITSSGSEFATLSSLPALSRGVHGEAYAVDQAGSIIVGYSWDRADRMNPVTWTPQNGTWRITALPYAAGGSRELGTLGGESTVPRGINAAREAVGGSAQANGEITAFFWSDALGMRQLPVSYGAWAFAVSGVRSDGTRLVVGAGGKPFAALVWVVRNP